MSKLAIEYERYKREVTPEIPFDEWLECVAGVDQTEAEAEVLGYKEAILKKE